MTLFVCVDISFIVIYLDCSAIYANRQSIGLTAKLNKYMLREYKDIKGRSTRIVDCVSRYVFVLFMYHRALQISLSYVTTTPTTTITMKRKP